MGLGKGLNKRHLRMFLKTKEGQRFVELLLGQLIDGFVVRDGKILDIEFKATPTLDLDSIEEAIAKEMKKDPTRRKLGRIV